MPWLDWAFAKQKAALKGRVIEPEFNPLIRPLGPPWQETGATLDLLTPRVRRSSIRH